MMLLPPFQLGQFQVHPLQRLARQSSAKRDLLAGLPQGKLEHPKKSRNCASKLCLGEIFPDARPGPVEECNLRKVGRRPSMFIRNLSPFRFVGVDPPFRKKVVCSLTPEFRTPVDGLRAQRDCCSPGDSLPRDGGFADGFAARHRDCGVQTQDFLADTVEVGHSFKVLPGYRRG